MFQQLLTITRNTFTEAIRQPIYAVLIMVGSLALVLNPFLAAYSMETGGGDNKILVDMGLSTVFLCSLLLAAVSATGVLVTEIENRTVLTVVSKPVARPIFVLAKFCGVAGAIGLAYFVLSLLFLLTLRHRVMSTASDHLDGPVVIFGLLAGLVALFTAAGGNYLYRWVFASTFIRTLAVTMTVAALLVALVGKDWHLQSPLTELQARDGRMVQVIIGLALVFEAVLLLTGIAIVCSTRLAQVMTILICVGVFLAGLVSNALNQLGNERLGLDPRLSMLDSLGSIAQAESVGLGMKIIFLGSKLLYVLLPNLQFFWPADALTLGNPLTLGHVAWVSMYGGLYLTAVLCLAVILFQTREVG